jgi:acyl carrier protein
LQITAEEIKDDQLLFGPGSLGLDSVDALQLVVALDKNFGLKIPTPAAGKEILHSVSTIAAAVQKNAPATGAA